MDGRSLTSFNRERGVVVDTALQLALKHAASQRLAVQWRTVGNHLQTTSAVVRDPNGSTVVGRGKGLGTQSIASAVFEALEHYYHLSEDIQPKVLTRSLNVVELDESLRGSSPDLQKIIGPFDVPLTCIAFESFAEPKRTVGVPAILFNPDFVPDSPEEIAFLDRTRLYRYSSNSGTASGLSAEEAQLHGLLEVIERDALSIALVKHVLSPRAAPARVVQRSTLTFPSQELIRHAEMESGGEVRVWDITSDIGVPVILCALTTRSGSLHRFFGSGASTCREYALERAVLEALQGHHIQTEFDTVLQPPITRNVDKMSLFQRCELRYGYFEYRGGESLIAWDEVPTDNVNDAKTSVSDQIVSVLNALRSKSIEAYWRVINDSGVYVTQVAVPQLERLFLISEGLPVGPSARAREFRAT